MIAQPNNEHCYHNTENEKSWESFVILDMLLYCFNWSSRWCLHDDDDRFIVFPVAEVDGCVHEDLQPDLHDAPHLPLVGMSSGFCDLDNFVKLKDMMCRDITTQRYLIDVCDVELWSFKVETIFQFLVPMLQSFPHDSWVAINELKVKILWWFSWWQEIHRFEISFPWVQFRPYLNHPGSSIQKYLDIQHHVIFNIFQDEWWFEQYSWALFKVRSLLWVEERWDILI